MKIGYIGGFWASNIGNSFYNLGALSLLKTLYGEDNVYFIPDPPGWMWKVENHYDFISNIDLDLVVISGPCLNKRIINVYKSIFDSFEKNKTKIAFISAGASSYTDDEAKVVQNFLNNYDVQFMSTRDEETYTLYKDCTFPVYNGLCTSMFLNDAVNVIPMQSNEKYAVMNFAFFHEPVIEKKESKYIIKKRNLFNFQKTLDGLKIVRTNNDIFSRRKYKIFNRENIYYSDLPYGYLSILKHANIVFSDRVHTCAATLILGGKAMYIKGSKRSHDGRNNLFKRIGVENIYLEPTGLDFDYINEEKHNMRKFLEKQI
jgi:hypothetical protein